MNHVFMDGIDESPLPAFLLDKLGFDIGYWKCVGALFSFAVVWRILSVFILKFMISKFQ